MKEKHRLLHVEVFSDCCAQYRHTGQHKALLSHHPGDCGISVIHNYFVVPSPRRLWHQCHPQLLCCPITQATVASVSSTTTLLSHHPGDCGISVIHNYFVVPSPRRLWHQCHPQLLCCPITQATVASVSSTTTLLSHHPGDCGISVIHNYFVVPSPRRLWHQCHPQLLCCPIIQVTVASVSSTTTLLSHHPGDCGISVIHNYFVVPSPRRLWHQCHPQLLCCPITQATVASVSSTTTLRVPLGNSL